MAEYPKMLSAYESQISKQRRDKEAIEAQKVEKITDIQVPALV